MLAILALTLSSVPALSSVLGWGVSGSSPLHVTESSGLFERHGDKITVSLWVDAAALLEIVGGEATADDYLEPCQSYLTAHYWLLIGDQKVVPEVLDVELIQEMQVGTTFPAAPMIRARFEFLVPADDFVLEVRQNLFAETELGHTHYLDLRLDGTERMLPVYPGREVKIPVEDPSLRGRAKRALAHCGGGLKAAVFPLDSLVLLLLFVLAANSGRAVAVGTVMFSGGLAAGFLLQTLGPLQPAPAATGAASAFSVLFLAAENQFAQDLRYRSWTMLLFGLVHGVNFGLNFEAVAEDSLTRGTNLLGFEAGIHFAQWAFVVVAALVVRARWLRPGPLLYWPAMGVGAVWIAMRFWAR